ncbi:MAG: N-acetylmuramoyl-L-alanine amidase [Odoribacteraceae bacterium]|nr:N-acetylmuramoyl-L-alanine amidase [Odoribacteraceae bacterium]
MLCVLGNIQGQTRVEKISCICIDPGHGGEDPGARNGKVKEKDITLDIALRLGKLIQQAYPDMKIVYTRTKDVAVALKTRGEMANKAKAQLFISIHVNSVKSAAPKGVEVYVLGLHVSEASLQVAMRENGAIRYEADYSVKYSGFNPDEMESYIIFNHLVNTFLSNSMAFAGPIHDELVKALGMERRGVKQAGFLVLKDVAMPAVLVETGFISNASDLKKLTSDTGKAKMARSIFNAFVTYKDELERNSVVIQRVQEKHDEPWELVYAVQVASARSRITDLKRFKLQEPVEELKIADRYRYYVCKCTSYAEAVAFQRKIRKSVKDCFIIAFHEGKLIPVAKAKEIENERKK